MDGILCVIKPEGFTSFDVVAKLRGIIGMRKIGHGGTLDPFATGVLPIFLGKATRVCDILPIDTKTYEAVFLFGCATDTLDITGEILHKETPGFSKEELLAAAEKFKGQIDQVPPMYSAVKVGGRKLYQIARSGGEVERPTRTVNIDELEILDFNMETYEVSLRISCSKGTYIRTLADDMGRALGTCAIVKSLLRTKAGIFSLGDCHTLEEVQAAKLGNTLHSIVKPMDTVFSSMKKLVVPDARYTDLMNGKHLSYDIMEDGTYAVYGESFGFLGLCSIEEGVLHGKKIFGERHD